MAKPDRIAEFKQAFGEAPELIEPFKTSKYSLPLKLVDFHREGSYPLATFEGRSPIEDENTLKVRIDYAGSLRLRREQIFTKPGENFVLNGTTIRYNIGPVDTVYSARGPVLVNPFRRDDGDWHLFSRQILVQSAGRPDVPLASAEYFDGNRSTQYELFLTYGEFGNLSTIPEVQTEGKDRPVLRAGTADIGVLSGVHIWELSISDTMKSETPIKQSSVNGDWVNLDGSPYLYKIICRRDRMDRMWGRGRLVFSRMHYETKSLMALSVPEWLNPDDYMRGMISDQWIGIPTNYPMRFAVGDRGQPLQWFSTFGKDDETPAFRGSSLRPEQ